ncbi:MAG: preprotein translocase subunit YajC [Planctomycetes bacterium]|nr:preprotein translocase subunit YajC [Planctomycetota bacterium]MCB9911333.1 preprotein translocase subunit YajC [Planctomycetota bacterium]MCB9912968.1 preprotein translocase subunit YajC [Planctomycetota bacterium]HRV81521.1 preprotein translocase subunit YajC [Planctomycetota bacterium]
MLPSIASLLAPLSSLSTPLLVLQGEGGSTTPTPGPGGVTQFLPLILVGVLAWFLLIQPERKRQKARQAMLAAIKKNDSVVTAGGLIGVVTKVEDHQVTVRIDEGVHVRVQRGSIAGLVQPDGAGTDQA